MNDVVYMKYTFRPVAGSADRLYCRQLKVTVESAKTKTGTVWSAWRNGVKGETEWYSTTAGARRVYSTAQSCIESLVQSSWLVDTE